MKDIKNYVILLAGGVGKRMNMSTPKQFLVVNNKPIIVYTLENFERNNQIEKVLVVCVKEWIGHLNELIKKYKLSKVEWIIEGGKTSHDSIENGVFFLNEKIRGTDFIMIHDAVRPILPQKAINEVIRVAHEKGNASSSTACYPPIVYTEDNISSISDIDREHVMLTASPQMYKYSLALKYYRMAKEDNRNDFTFTSSLFIHYGERIFFAKGTTSNIKITNKEDIALMNALLKIPEELLYSEEEK